MTYDTITHKGKDYPIRTIEHLGMTYNFADFNLLDKLTDECNELKDNECEATDEHIEYYLDGNEWKLSDNDVIKLTNL
jgi:hypothetical protein